jgi:hypothetical protein
MMTHNLQRAGVLHSYYVVASCNDDSHEVWPLGKLLWPSLITLGSPWHMTPVVMLLYT